MLMFFGLHVRKHYVAFDQIFQSQLILAMFWDKWQTAEHILKR